MGSANADTNSAAAQQSGRHVALGIRLSCTQRQGEDTWVPLRAAAKPQPERSPQAVRVKDCAVLKVA